MKKVFFAALFISLSVMAFAQESESRDEEDTRKFKKENLFTGGDLNVAFYNGATILGASPYLGYSVTKWLDAGVSFGFTYISQRDYYSYGDKLRQTTIAPGAFVRIFPINFIFAQVLLEHNFIHQNYIYPDGSGMPDEPYNIDVNTLLLGLGVASDREAGNNTYFYFSVSFDVLGQRNSPYLDNLRRTIPIIKGGVNIALFQGSRTHYRGSNQ